MKKGTLMSSEVERLRAELLRAEEIIRELRRQLAAAEQAREAAEAAREAAEAALNAYLGKARVQQAAATAVAAAGVP